MSSEFNEPPGSHHALRLHNEGIAGQEPFDGSTMSESYRIEPKTTETYPIENFSPELNCVESTFFSQVP